MAPLIGGDNHPGTIPRLFVYLFDDEEYLDSLIESIQLFTTGLVLAVLVAIPLGIIMARLVILRIAIETYILLLYVTPMIALIPFIMSLFGFDFWPGDAGRSGIFAGRKVINPSGAGRAGSVSWEAGHGRTTALRTTEELKWRRR